MLWRIPRPLGDFDILLERLVAGVNHHAGETLVNALLAQLERVAVIQMDGDGMLDRLTAASMSFLR